MEGNCEKWCNLRLNWCGSISNWKLPFSDSWSTNNHLYYLSVYYGNVDTFFTVCHWRCSYMIFRVPYLYRLLRGLIYSHISCDRNIWWMTSKKNRALLLYYLKLCASFQIHWWIQTGFTVQKRSIRVEIGDMLSHVTLKFNGWSWKTIGHPFYATSSFVQHFVAIGEFTLELQSGNAQSGSNLTIFRAVRPWNLTDDLAKQ